MLLKELLLKFPTCPFVLLANCLGAEYIVIAIPMQGKLNLWSFLHVQFCRLTEWKCTMYGVMCGHFFFFFHLNLFSLSL